MRGNRNLKLIDRYIGIIIVFFLGLLQRNKKSEFKDSDSIAVFAPVAIGDSVLIFSTLQSLRKQRSFKSLTIYCSSLTKDLVDFFVPDANIEVIDITSVFSTIMKIREQEYTHWFDCSQWARLSSIVSFFSRSNYKHGFNTSGQFRDHVYSDSVHHSNKLHEIHNFHNLFKLDYISEYPDKIITKSMGKSKKVLLHICPSGERSYLKMWPTENWLEITRLLLNKGFNVQFTGAGKDSLEVEKIISHLKDSKRVESLVNKIPVKELPATIEESDLIITVNTGILHIASFTNTPIIALNGPTNPLRWGPLSKNAISLKPSLECAPCLNLGFEYGCNQNDCMKDISVKQVTDAIESLL